ncbi:MAG TPA: Na+/H+ antiporter [Polyangiaceae bacterium]|nr:Na+/H+ antiporter [Polyangiaceae bacterium]
MRPELAFVFLFSVATAVAIAARRWKVPYTVALVVAGTALGASHLVTPPHLTKDLLFALFLPGLVFEAAYHLEARAFWRNKLAVNALAVPGLVAAMALTAAILVPLANGLHFVEGFGLAHGLVFGAIIVATDPVAVVGLFKSLGAPKRLATLVEGESLVNDGTAAVVFSLVLAAVAGGGPFSAAGAALDFVRVVGLGGVAGALVGLAASEVIRRVDDPMIEITLTTVAAYGSFAAAEHFHVSGIIATLVAGMLCGNYAARTGMSPSTRVAVETFWEYVAFALNSTVFLLIGFEVDAGRLLASWLPIVAAFAAAALGRAAVVAGVVALLGRTREAVPWRWAPVLTWGGLRGGLSMVLALGLPQGFPHRDLLVTMTYGVVLLSILVQGLTMGPLLRRLGLSGGGPAHAAYELHRGAARAAQAALEALSRLERQGATQRDVLGALRGEYRARLTEAERAIDALHLEAAELREAEAEAARRGLLAAEKDALLEARRQGLIGDEASERLLADVDARLVELEESGPPPSAPRAGRQLTTR